MLQEFNRERSIASPALAQLIQEEVRRFLEKSHRAVDSERESRIRGISRALQLRSTRATLF